MSHYTLLVIGEDVEGQLAPFDENISVAPYRRYWDSDDIERWEGILSKDDGERPVLTPAGEKATLEEIAAVYNERYREDDDEVFVDNGGIYEMTSYNPQSRWDWYQIGGRWQGYFAVRRWSSCDEAWNTIHDEAVRRGVQPDDAVAEADRYRDARAVLVPTLGEPSWSNADDPEIDGADVLLRGDVDAEAMRAAAATRAGEWWDRMHAVVADLPEAESWDDLVFRVKEKELEIDEARKLYHAQRRLQAVAEHDRAEAAKKESGQPLVGWGGDGVDEYQRYTREQYIERARAAACAPYAYVYRGEWVEPGRMGWFCMDNATELSRTEYRVRFNELFDSLPADTPLALVDCHI